MLGPMIWKMTARGIHRMDEHCKEKRLTRISTLWGKGIRFSHEIERDEDWRCRGDTGPGVWSVPVGA